jgi:hypothetical protein
MTPNAPVNVESNFPNLEVTGPMLVGEFLFQEKPIEYKGARIERIAQRNWRLDLPTGAIAVGLSAKQVAQRLNVWLGLAASE